MPRKRRNPKTRRAEIPAEMIEYLSDRETGDPWIFFTTDADLLAAWNEVRDEILTEWIAGSPGSRPSFWWRFGAPRQPLGTFEGCYFDGKLPEPRRRLGGIGTPSHECLAYTPHYNFGIPAYWVNQWESDYYNGRARHVDGHLIGEDYEEGDFEGVAIDSEDPPRYESEASYLERHGLFRPGEKKRLRKADFEPDLIAPVDDDDEAPGHAA